MIRRAILVWAALAPLIVGAQVQDPTNKQAQLVTKSIGIDQKLDAQIPLDLKFRDEEGREVTLDQYFHKRPILLAPVFFTCKGTCLLIFDGVIRSVIGMKKDDVGKTFDVLAISIHPKETKEDAQKKEASVLEVYDRPGAREGWHFLTGDWDSIQALTKAIGFRFTYDEKRDQINHPAGVMVLTPEGKVSQYFYGVEYPSKLVLASLRKAKEGQIGTVSDVKLFGCFEYDPVTGGYKIVVLRVLQLSGMATVAILALSVAVMSLRSRKKGAIDPGGGGPGTSA